MNSWATWLADTPPTLQRLIARSNRVSLPRRCDAPARLARLRQALCHARVVEATYHALPVEVQAALHELRASPRGLDAATLTECYGPLRPLDHLLADRTPR